MDLQKNTPQPKLRNQEAHARHQKEVFWQITLPLVLGIILFLGASILVSVGASIDVSRLADVTLVWLIVPWLVVAFLVIVVLSALVYGVVKLIQVLPFAFYRLNSFLRRVHEIVKKAGDKAVEPVMKTASLRGRLQALRSRTTWRG
jgi:predicted PurR-regulated permease PerM